MGGLDELEAFMLDMEAIRVGLDAEQDARERARLMAQMR